MRTRVTSDELWLNLEPLSDAEIDAIYEAALSDRRYKATLIAMFSVYLAVLVGVCYAMPPFYRAFHPALPIKIGIAVLVLLYIWYGFKLVHRLNRGLYDQAVLRQLEARRAGGGA